MRAPPLPPTLARALDAVSAALTTAGFAPMLVGALAAWAWGHPRTTGDIDMVVLVEPGEEPLVSAALAPLGWPLSEVERNDFGRRIKVRAPGLPVEVFLAPPLPLQQREFQRAVTMAFGDRDYRVLSKEDFVLRKLVNLKIRDDPHDRLDIVMALSRNLDDFDTDYVRQHCAVQRVCGKFEAYLETARETWDQPG